MSLVTDVLFDYQVEAAERIAEQEAILLADQPGLGKTLEVLGGLELAGMLTGHRNILILTPIINAQTTWIDALTRFIAPRYDINVIDLSYGSAKQKNERLNTTPGLPNFFVANHNAVDYVSKSRALRVSLDIFKWDAVVVDESHLVLPITSQKPTQFRRGLSKLVMYHPGCKRIAISGTPDRGKLENRFGTWNFMYPNVVGYNRYDWLEEHFFMVEQRISNNRTIKVPHSLRSERTWQLFSEKWMIRRTKSEVLAQLPPKQYVDVELELSKDQKLNYFVAQMDYEKKLRDGEDENAASMVFALRSRQFATAQYDGDFNPIVGGESAKLEWLKEWLSERDQAELKVVIVSQFSKVLHWLKKELQEIGIDADVLDGSTPTALRPVIQERFQRGDLRVVLLSGTMGVGINLDAADDLIMVDSPYDPDRIEQIEDRVHRASNIHNVTIWNLIAVNTIDQAIAEKVSKRYKLTRKLLDGDRGVAIGRNVLARIRKQREEQPSGV